VLDQLGPALISQETMFLFGSTGNGKTSLAERTVKVFDDAIVVPYAVEVDGQVISVFDPVITASWKATVRAWTPLDRVPAPCGHGRRRTLADMLELRLDPATNIYAAPAQMKANNASSSWMTSAARSFLPPCC